MFNSYNGYNLARFYREVNLGNLKNYITLQTSLRSNSYRNFEIGNKKNGQATFIAPLQPSTLAMFPSWGSSKGAGRKRLARHKGSKNSHFLK